jgi:hypothetical protein
VIEALRRWFLGAEGAAADAAARRANARGAMRGNSRPFAASRLPQGAAAPADPPGTRAVQTLRWGPGQVFGPAPPLINAEALEAFLANADFYSDGDSLYATDGDRLFALTLSGQEWTQLTAWPAGRRLHEMPRAAFETILGAETGGGAARWRRCGPMDAHNALVLSLLAVHAVKGGGYCEMHIPAHPGPELYLLLPQADWAGVLAGRALSLANSCEIAAGEVRSYRFCFNGEGLGGLAVELEDSPAPHLVYRGPWHPLALREIAP